MAHLRHSLYPYFTPAVKTFLLTDSGTVALNFTVHLLFSDLTLPSLMSPFPPAGAQPAHPSKRVLYISLARHAARVSARPTDWHGG